MQAFEVARKIFLMSAKDSLDEKSRTKTDEVWSFYSVPWADDPSALV